VNIVSRKIKEYKCEYCYRPGSYTDWIDGIEIAVCFKHLSKHTSD